MSRCRQGEEKEEAKERGRGEMEGRMVAAGHEKNVSQWQQGGLALFPT